MRRYLFLYLAIACFIGLLVIFVVDGYLGIYDTVRVKAGEYEQTIEPDQWYRDGYIPSSGTTWGGKVFFTYEVENRRFSDYETRIQASVWQENEKVADLFSGEKSVAPFDKVTVEWTLDSKDLESRGFSPGQYTVKIERGEVERAIVTYFNVPPNESPIKQIPVPR